MTPNTSRTQTFSVTNNSGPGPLNFTVACVKPSFVTSCSPSASNVNVQVGQSSSFTVTYHVGTSTGSGNIAINITGPGADFSASIAVTLPVYTVTVTPKTATPVTIDTATSYTQSFTVHNAGSSSEIMDLSASCSPPIATRKCALDSSTVTLAANASKSVQLSYEAGSALLADTATAGLHASVRAYTQASDSGYITVQVPPPPPATPVVTPPSGVPEGTTITALPNTASTQAFLVRNGGGSTGTFYLTASCEVLAWNCSPSVNSVQLAASEDTTVVVAYTTSSTGVGGTVALGASTTMGAQPSDSGWVQVDVPVSVAVTPDGTLVGHAPGTATYNFSLTTSLPTSTDFAITVACPGPGATGCSGPSSPVTASFSQPTTVAVSYTAGTLGTSGSVTVTAQQVSDAANSDSGVITVLAVADTGCVGSYTQITPCLDTATVAAGSTSSVTFTLTNNSSASQNYILACQVSGAITSCSGGVPGITIDRFSSYARTVSFNTSDSTGGPGTLRLKTIGDGGDDVSGGVNVAVTETRSVQVARTWIDNQTPDGGEGGRANFTVKNAGNVWAAYEIAPVCSGAVIQCKLWTGLPLDTVELAAAEKDTNSARVDFSTELLEEHGTVGIRATDISDGSARDSSWFDVTVVVPPAVVAEPRGKAVRAIASHSNIQQFTVRSMGPDTLVVTLEALCTETVTSCDLATGQANPVTIAPSDTALVNVEYDAGPPESMGVLSLAASSSTASGTLADTGFVDVTPVLTYAARVTPGQDRTVVPPGGFNAAVMYVRNTGTVTTQYHLTADCEGPVFASNGCTVISPYPMLAADSVVQVIVFWGTTSSIDADSGTLTLTATQDDPAGNASASGSMTIVAHASHQDTARVDVASVNPGSTLDRDLCLTVAAGKGAAWQCGDLRIAHALPSTRTMSRLRTPVLLYNSQLAHPHPVVAAIVTIGDSVRQPDSVKATLTVSGTTTSKQWTGAFFSPGQSARIAISFDALSMPTGVYPYTLTVSNIYNSPRALLPASSTGKLIIVNRSESPFGAGWWLAGYEQIRLTSSDSTSLLWIGGDGSARIYSRVTTGVWVAPNMDRPDTLKLVGSNYVRYLPHGLKVKFDQLGRHIATINRLRHETTFNPHSSGFALSSITLHTPDNGPTTVTKEYTFSYDANDHLQSVTAPGLENLTREVTLSSDGQGRVTSITDPDAKRIGFAYDPVDLNRIVADTGRRDEVTSFAYDEAKRLTRASIDIGDYGMITTRFRNLDSLALSTSATTSAAESSYVVVNGPRTDTTVTQFWLDRFGAPRRIVDALGYETTLERNDPQWPALVTSVVNPTQHAIRASYDDQGNLTDLVDDDPFGDGANADPQVTHWHYDPLWQFADKMISPAGVVTTFAYDADKGNRLWQQVGPDQARRVTFNYGNDLDLPSSTELPQTAKDSIAYDVLGNVVLVGSPLHYWTTYARDSIGRDTLVASAISSTDHGYSLTGDNSNRLRQRSEYDIMDRVLLSQQIGPAMSGEPKETITVQNHYDDAGNLDTLTRSASPDIPSPRTPIGPITTVWVYDLAGRRVVEAAPDGERDSTVYDPAGNAVAYYSRRHDENGDRYMLTMAYDAMNRLVQRVVPPVTYPSWSSGIPSVKFVAFGDSLYGGLTVPADTATFTYDAAGRLIRANNTAAWINREYYPNGSLESETQRIRTVTGSNFHRHVYTVSYTYDLAGRRIGLKHPSQLAPLDATGERAASVIYGYDEVTGYPDTVIDPLGATFLYGYNNRGDLYQLTFDPVTGTGTEEVRTYDDDGRLIQSTLTAGDPTVEQSSTLSYDARHKLLQATNTLGRRDELTAAYSGLGYLAHSHQVEHGMDLYGWSLSRFAVYEEFLHEGLGNVAVSSTTDTITYAFNDSTAIHSGGDTSAYVAGVGRLLKREGSERTDTLTYDEAGNTVFLSQPRLPLASPREDRASYYAADGKLWGTDHRTLGSSNDPSGSFTIAREEYRYDALGRRVFVRARRWCDTTINPDPCRISVVRRTVWDGNQELDEIQMPGWDTTSVDDMENDTLPVKLHLGNDANTLFADMNPFFGRVAYTHGLGIDRPLDVIRMNYVDAQGSDFQVWDPFTIVPQWDYRGRPVSGLFADGTHTHCLTTDRCARVVWPDGWYVNRRRLFTPLGWHGTLVEEKQDYSGIMYRRNRYYDPQTGRFTQEDPIGLAGGLNLYGFAAGDPVNYNDPFGTCPFWVAIIDGPEPGPADAVAAAICGIQFTFAVLFARDAAAVASANTSRAARRSVMRTQGIPTSRPPDQQCRGGNGSVQYRYEASRDVTQVVEHHSGVPGHNNTADRYDHWEAGAGKDPEQYGTRDDGSHRVHNNDPDTKQPKSKCVYPTSGQPWPPDLAP